MAKKGGRRRYYGRKKKGGRARFGIPSIAGIVVGVNALNKFGVFDALRDRSMQPVIDATTGPNAVQDLIDAAVPAIGVAVVRKAVGPINLFRVGRWNIRIL